MVDQTTPSTKDRFIRIVVQLQNPIFQRLAEHVAGNVTFQFNSIFFENPLQFHVYPASVNRFGYTSVLEDVLVGSSSFVIT
jgi:hypothetical protein